MRFPDFFIVGAPKCGTTALYRYLSDHPGIFVPGRKEPHHFGSDLEFRRRRQYDRTSYLRLYQGALPEQLAGDASVWYLYSTLAAAEIKAVCPTARIIAMLRRPPDMMYALHSEFLNSGNEDIADFGEAIRAEPDRMSGRRIPATVNFVAGLFYRETARYAQQLERYFDAFGREQVLTITFDDFVDDTPGIYASVLEFLGLPNDARSAFDRVNPNKRPRSVWLREMLMQPPPVVRRVARAVISPEPRRRLYRAVLGANTRSTDRPPMDASTRHELVAEFQPEVEQLGALLGRDLSHWSDG